MKCFVVPGGMIVDIIEYHAEIIIKRCEDRERSEYIAIFKVNGKVLKILRNIDPVNFAAEYPKYLKPSRITDYIILSIFK